MPRPRGPEAQLARVFASAIRGAHTATSSTSAQHMTTPASQASASQRLQSLMLVSLLRTNPALTATPPLSARSFSSTAATHRQHHFDTLKFTQRLETEGFSAAQANALRGVLSDVISEAIQNLTRTLVAREDALKASYTQKIDFNALRTELTTLDNSEAALTKTSHERLHNEIQKLNQRLRDEVARTQSSVRLDLNLEKGRIREEAGVQELRVRETETRIEQEVAGLRERIEGVKFDTVRWLAGVTTGTAALLLGAWRLFM